MQTEAPPKAEGNRRSLGQVLLDSKLITEDQLQDALDLQQNGDQRRLGGILIDQGWLEAGNLALALSIHLNLPFINLSHQDISPDILHIVPEEFARRYNLIPVEVIDGELAVVMEDPTDIRVLQEISALSGMKIQPSVGATTDINTAIDLHYKSTTRIEREVAEFAGLLAGTDLAEADIALEPGVDDPVVRAVNLILLQAVRDRASDIHIVPDHEAVRVRYRVDGLLRDALTLPSGSNYPLLSRLKVMAGMNIAERRRPQDGQFSFVAAEHEVFFRVATSDTTWGEMVTLRILGRSESILALDGLGLQQEAVESFMGLIQSPLGMVLVSGPTGSGKTTTLYAALNQLDREHHNVMTIEDPVEFNFEGISQIQVNRAAEITFAAGLRGIMRLDPDVIMVGEVRDGETAQAAVQAALTGHLVLSSVHANDAPGTLYRVAHLGVERYLLTSGLLGSVSQRLVRVLCPHCKVESEPTEQDNAAYEVEMKKKLAVLWRGEGCTYCGETGFLGRTGVFEVMVASEEIKSRFSEEASVAEIRSLAIEQGMISMYQDGMRKVEQGITTPLEVRRNVYFI
jgi:type II secretory ATPase GspE/PulE/Tfp pilus assembly ATPase PilB-like protein